MHDRRRRRALVVLAAMQFMLVVDLTVVLVALPKSQTDLHFSQSGLAGVLVFGTASATCGAATAPPTTPPSTSPSSTAP